MSKTYSLKGKVSREVALAIAEKLVKELPDTQIVGSLRRGCEVVGDVDLLTTSQETMGLFLMLVDEVFVQGDAKVSARKGGIQVDLNFTIVEAMGSALLHHTGSAQFTPAKSRREVVLPASTIAWSSLAFGPVGGSPRPGTARRQSACPSSSRNWSPQPGPIVLLLLSLSGTMKQGQR
jgi:hypothetical protein